MKATIDITKEHFNGIIKELDKTNYFNLGNDSSSRTDLFHFALALGLKKDEPTVLSSINGFIRTSTEDLKPFIFVYKSIYYDKVLSPNNENIDKITDIDAALDIVEQYANTGFDILSKMRSEYTDDVHFAKKILNEIDKIYEDFFKEYRLNSLYTE